MENELEVTEAQVWDDFDAVLNPEGALVDPGPEWRSMAEIVAASPYGASKVGRLVDAAVNAGQMECRRGRNGGRVKSLYRVVRAL